MFRRILVANRGEVAARVMRTCRRMGIGVVLVATDADADLGFLGDADRVVAIGGPKAYLDADRLIDVAEAEGCSAIHPGWGFLSENPSFAARCAAARITLVGPGPEAMRRMGDKDLARQTMRALGVLPVPGSDGAVVDAADARRQAQAIGLPVLLKALAGGGGRGMRRVHHLDEVEAAWQEASGEAESAFGDGRMYMERLLTGARHIEFQVMGGATLEADGRLGFRVDVLGERECSIQRRHQKLVEETPSPALSDATRRAVADRIAAALTALRYPGAGTVEMLLGPDGALWFMEMNTRLQVEHTITEVVTGLDLVEWQLRVAANQPLPERGGPTHLPAPRGHAIECRINAEEPRQDFRPVPGRIRRFELPRGEGLRVDTHLRVGDRVSPHYDSMIAKVIAHGDTRQQALDRMDAALAAFGVEGVPTTIALHRRLLAHPEFRAGAFDTHFLERVLPELLA
jgi:acetyl-CoA carboxylase, biotin carboxylase subunit